METKAERTIGAAETEIRKDIFSASNRVFQQRDLSTLFQTQRASWKIANWARVGQFIDFAVSRNILRKLHLKSEFHGSKVRYAREDASAFDVALSLAKGGYLCHGTAVFLHGLNDQIPKTIYVNREQGPKPSRLAELTQKRIDFAFSGRQRTSKYVFMFDSDRIVLLSGKSTGRLDVIRIDGVAGPSSDVTSIRRTLVDVVVRPGYAGGITQVLEAYRGAKGRVSGESLLLILKKMNFVYPYHQAIGFLLEKADYPEADIAPFRQIDMDFDFYLIHGMREREYDHRWRLFYPKGL